ncbi:SDR family NAD(P)-dependent oxidoreductase [Chryseobacterium sp. PTM-20240506]|uniref:SDR family NAD(P)-dependent oxidoreductase n=1 Tax=unclassified Chryseobacterium TaxID=2593645 RepID=UPI0023595D45|nr:MULTISPECIES: SDR family oxidoreductase [unclassified Chryseobacterium]MDC8104577.1 SDR family oxidoreductase [Chryseobacterium sp. B21-037]MDQ1806108.1 SDR family oxidoreductase [Chryseobacterium sp. CKR4-1]
MKNIVIVGCGKGIGHATAEILSEQNKIIGISRTINPGVNHANITFHQMDILSGNLDEITFPEVVDGLVYSPGSINLKPFNRLTIDEFKNDFEINVIGAVKVIQKLLPNLKKSESASIVLFSSVAAKLGMPFHSSIAASKNAVEGLTKSLAAEFSAHKIRVNAIAPSLTDTELASSLLSTPEKKEASAKRHPLQRIGNAEEIAEMTAFLISDKSSWITGQIFGIDGGMGSVKL